MRTPRSSSSAPGIVCATHCSETPLEPRTQAGMPSLRVVAYNFLAGGGKKRTGHWSRLVRGLGADLLLAQECRLPEDCPGERFRPNPDDGLIWGPASASRWGSAVFMRSASLAPIAVPGYAGWIVGGRVENGPWMNGGPVRVFSIHCP